MLRGVGKTHSCFLARASAEEDVFGPLRVTPCPQMLFPRLQSSTPSLSVGQGLTLGDTQQHPGLRTKASDAGKFYGCSG